MKSLNSKKIAAITPQEMQHIVAGKKQWVETDRITSWRCIASNGNDCAGILVYTTVYEELQNGRGKVLEYRTSRD